MNNSPNLILVPGAWMGGWIWEPTVERLRARGVNASTLTLAGLGEQDAERTSHVRLEDHVHQVRQVTIDVSGDVILVSHSYSAVVTAQVADQCSERIAGLVHIGGFLPADGRALLDDWGSSDREREQEAIDIRAAGNLWAAPTRSMLKMQPGLKQSDREMLASRLSPHPGSTVTDPVRMSNPVSSQPTTYVALSMEGPSRAWQAAPAIARSARRWRKRTLTSGHWPMLTHLEELVALLVEEAQWYSHQATLLGDGDAENPSGTGRGARRGD